MGKKRKAQKYVEISTIASPKNSAKPSAAGKKAESNPTTISAPTKRKGKSEIDDIFAQIKPKMKTIETKKPLDGGADVQSEERPAKGAGAEQVQGSKDDLFGDNTGRTRKRTEEGYAIYSEEELGLGKAGGGTDQCPFDCTCCF